MSKKVPKRVFNFSNFKQRHVALKILYFGWDFSGIAGQKDCDTTIEYHLFSALTKTCLIESPEKCHYNRCGRTDKGVSAYGQVVNLNMRSNLVDEDDPNNVGLFSPEDYSGGSSNDKLGALQRKIEIDYVHILNSNLPSHIKVIAWAPVRKDFSARFDCESRSYSYIFPKGDLCIVSMQESLAHLIGEHDFRNICSFDLKNGVIRHVRTILSAKIDTLNRNQLHDQPDFDDHYKFYEIVIVGKAFLYHQIRCIMTILFLVGSKKEKPGIFKDLLDLNKCSARPHYNPASPLPLCLFDCKYKLEDLPRGWIHDETALCNLINKLKKVWLDYKTKVLMIERAIADLESSLGLGFKSDDHEKRVSLNLHRWRDFGLLCDNMNDSNYVNLLKRSRDDTLEYKLEMLNNKKLKDS